MIAATYSVHENEDDPFLTIFIIFSFIKGFTNKIEHRFSKYFDTKSFFSQQARGKIALFLSFGFFALCFRSETNLGRIAIHFFQSRIFY